MKKLLIVLAILGGINFAYNKFERPLNVEYSLNEFSGGGGDMTDDAPKNERPPVMETNYRCDGRTYCSEMRSCDEATWFIRHCPGMKMDGDNDGIPCESQWCRNWP